MRLATQLVLACAALLAACKSDPEGPAHAFGEGALLVAIDLSNPPFAVRDADGLPAGSEVELIERIALSLGREVSWRHAPFADLLVLVERGDVELACGTIGVTAERAERVAFTRPYYETAIAVLVRAGAGEPALFADLAGRRVAAAAGTTSERAVRRYLPEARLVRAPEGISTAELLLSGEVEAVALDAPFARRTADESDGGLRVLPFDLAPERYAFALPKGRSVLLEDIDECLERLERDGSLYALHARHGL